MPDLLKAGDKKLERLIADWEALYPECLKLWSMFTRLRLPVFCRDRGEAKKEELLGSFAQIRLTDHRIILDMQYVLSLGLGDFGREIMGHEIGHHVYCPADLSDYGRMIARMRRSLPGHEDLAPFIGNLYTDLLINDRLFRTHGLKMDRIYSKLKQGSGDKLWNLYMRIYEILWALPKMTLAAYEIPDEMEGDARLACDLVRAFAREWIKGSGRFAAICLPYIIDNEHDKTREYLKPWIDTRSPGGSDALPEGLTGMDEGEDDDSLHPVLDGEDAKKKKSPGQTDKSPGRSDGNYREPYEYGELLKAMGIKISEREAAMRYYRERAIPHLIPFPVQETPQSREPLPEGLDVWDISSPLERIDWIETGLRSPVVIPGLTTLERHYGVDSGGAPDAEPVDLDLYVDSSGSMPNPQYVTSYLTLAGTIIALSALRSGSRVQATLWSGTGQFETTKGFTSREEEILAVLCGFFGGATAFPIHVLRDTYSERSPRTRRVHILIISDEGVDTLYSVDEKRNKGYDIAGMALKNSRHGGTMVLNLYRPWKDIPDLVKAAAQGWDVYRVTGWDELVDFSRSFVKRHYQRKNTAA